VDRYAFSCFFFMTADGRRDDNDSAKKPIFGKSIIRTACKLDYGTAQQFIELPQPVRGKGNGNGKGKGGGVDYGVTAADLREECRPAAPHTLTGVINDVRTLHKIGMARRKRRFNAATHKNAEGVAVAAAAATNAGATGPLFNKDAEGGSLRLNKIKLSYTLDTEKNPLSFRT
jgi:hypothetical protein